MRIKYSFFAFILFLSTNILAQTDSADLEIEDEPIEWIKPSENEKTRLGIIMGMQMCTTPGGEISNNRPMVGLLAGTYGRLNFKKGWSLQQGLHLSFRGSNFNNDANGIRSLRLLYIDAPFLIMKRLSKNSKRKLGLGMQYSHLFNSTLYLTGKSYPTKHAPIIEKNDWAAMASYQYQFTYFAYQVNLKYGFRNLNLYRPWPGDQDNTIKNQNGQLKNISLELTILF